MENSSSLDLKQGTVSFWIRAGKFEWDNNQENILFEASREGGRVRVIKDAENKLRASLEVEGNRGEILTEAGGLSCKKDHQVAFTWNQEENRIVLYLDGEKIGEDKIK